MRIQRRALLVQQAKRLVEETAKAAFAKCIDGRVCGQSCTIKCGDCGSTSCQCICSPCCPDAAKHLSSDPDKYPLERGITPLVFEMKRLGIFQPCWSCEGHVSADGALWKLPRVWFYCDSIVQVRLLADTLDKLAATAKLAVPWQVVINFSDPDNPETTFSLEPRPHVANTVTLAILRNDADQIARSLEFQIPERARLIQRQYQTGHIRA